MLDWMLVAVCCVDCLLHAINWTALCCYSCNSDLLRFARLVVSYILMLCGCSSFLFPYLHLACTNLQRVRQIVLSLLNLLRNIWPFAGILMVSSVLCDRNISYFEVFNAAVGIVCTYWCSVLLHFVCFSFWIHFVSFSLTFHTACVVSLLQEAWVLVYM